MRNSIRVVVMIKVNGEQRVFDIKEMKLTRKEHIPKAIVNFIMDHRFRSNPLIVEFVD